MQKFWLVYYLQKIAPQTKTGKYFQIWFFPRFGGKNGGVLRMRMQFILDSSFARLGSAPIWGGKKGEFRDSTISPRVFLRGRSWKCVIRQLRFSSFFSPRGKQQTQGEMNCRASTVGLNITFISCIIEFDSVLSLYFFFQISRVIYEVVWFIAGYKVWPVGALRRLRSKQLILQIILTQMLSLK